MKVEELRIGNWVKTCTPDMPIMIPYVEAQVQAITMFHELEFLHTPFSQGLTMAVRHTMGIPLTPEWLGKLGFINHPKAVPHPNWKTKDGFCLFDWGREYKCTDYKFRDTFNTNMGQVSHVHQLQNLYFALTGEELKMKPQPILGHNK